MALAGTALGAAVAFVHSDPARPAASSPVHVNRLYGADRVATAIAISNQMFPRWLSAPAIVLSRSDSYADALAGTALASQVQGPLLLTSSSALDPATAAEIQRVGAEGVAVFLLGGTAALSDAVASSVAALGTVNGGAPIRTVRLAGANRNATAVAVANAILAGQPPKSVFLADGTTFGSALVAGSIGGTYAYSGGATPLLLTAGNQLPAETAAFLATWKSSLKTIVTFGAPASTAYPSGIAKVASDDASLSAQEAADYHPVAQGVGVASVANFPDALAGGVWAAHYNVPLLLTDPNALSPADGSYLEQHPAIVGATVFGGPAAVSDGVVAAVAAGGSGGGGGGVQLIAPSTLPDGVVGQGYWYDFCGPGDVAAPNPYTLTFSLLPCSPAPGETPSGGQQPYHFQLGSGTGFPPIGLSVQKDGIVSGYPTSEGSSTFEVCAVDLGGNQACVTVTLKIGTGQSGGSYDGTYSGVDSGSAQGPHLPLSIYDPGLQFTVAGSAVTNVSTGNNDQPGTGGNGSGSGTTDPSGNISFTINYPSTYVCTQVSYQGTLTSTRTASGTFNGSGGANTCAGTWTAHA